MSLQRAGSSPGVSRRLNGHASVLLSAGEHQPGAPRRGGRPAGALGEQGSKVDRRRGRVGGKCPQVPVPFGDFRAANARTGVEKRRVLAHRLRVYKNSLPADAQAPVGEVAWRVAKCGTVAHGNTEQVSVRESAGGSRHVAGIAHCNRAVCPACAPFLAAKRREQLAPLVAANVGAGRHFHLVLTLRHRLGSKWLELASAKKAIWKRIQQRVRWRGKKGEGAGEVLGFVRADEVTYGRHGWHDHSHVLLTLRADVDPVEFFEWFRLAWEAGARQEGRTADLQAQDRWWSEIAPARLGDVAGYVTKAADEARGVVPREDGAETAAAFADAELLEHVAAAEVLGGAAKHGAAPWDIALEHPERYVELYTASKGFRWFSTSGIWKTKKLEELEDDDAAGAEREKTGEVLVEVSTERWNDLMRHRQAREARAWLLGMIANPEVDRATFLREWRAFWTAWDAPGNPYKNDDDGEPRAAA